jgi:hypothetical protein
MSDPTVVGAEMPEPKPPNEAGSTQCVVRWMVELPNGMWLGAWDKEAFDAYGLACRAAAMEECAALCDDMALYTGFDCVAAIRSRTGAGKGGV